MVNIIKELIKNQIKKTNTYKIVLIENENLKNETKNLKDYVNRIHNEKLKIKYISKQFKS